MRTRNRTMYQQSDVWPLKDASNPLDGRLLKDPPTSRSCSAVADKYGRLHHLLEQRLETLHSRLRSVSVTFELFNVPAEELSKQLKEETFARIEVWLSSDTMLQLVFCINPSRCQTSPTRAISGTTGYWVILAHCCNLPLLILMQR
jgi:hypothetical protein